MSKYIPPHLLPYVFDDESIKTRTSIDQTETECDCAPWLSLARPSTISRPPEVSVLLDEDQHLLLMKDAHVSYLLRALEAGLPASYVSLDASKTWIAYWILQALDLLDAPPVHLHTRLIELLSHCQNAPSTSVRPSSVVGGFGGGAIHYSHTAATYAAVLALLVIGTPEALGAIDRDALYRFYMSCKDESGGFRVQSDGEIDVRGAYTVVAIADLVGILTPELVANTADFLLGCQTYEGGFAGEPGNEGHGGYTFCAVAALAILGQLHRADIPALCRWISMRQMSLEGGFSGRPNKLVDACYSFWQGAVFAILQSQARIAVPGECGDVSIMNRRSLQEYILACCQQLEGGLRDKPTASRDHYHSCYALGGLSVAQYSYDSAWNAVVAEVVGNPTNQVAATHPLYNLRVEKVANVREHFSTLPPFVAR